MAAQLERCLKRVFIRNGRTKKFVAKTAETTRPGNTKFKREVPETGNFLASILPRSIWRQAYTFRFAFKCLTQGPDCGPDVVLCCWIDPLSKPITVKDIMVQAALQRRRGKFFSSFFCFKLALRILGGTRRRCQRRRLEFLLEDEGAAGAHHLLRRRGLDLLGSNRHKHEGAEEEALPGAAPAGRSTPLRVLVLLDRLLVMGSGRGHRGHFLAREGAHCGLLPANAGTRCPRISPHR